MKTDTELQRFVDLLDTMGVVRSKSLTSQRADTVSIVVGLEEFIFDKKSELFTEAKDCYMGNSHMRIKCSQS